MFQPTCQDGILISFANIANMTGLWEVLTFVSHNNIGLHFPHRMILWLLLSYRMIWWLLLSHIMILCYFFSYRIILWLMLSHTFIYIVVTFVSHNCIVVPFMCLKLTCIKWCMGWREAGNDTSSEGSGRRYFPPLSWRHTNYLIFAGYV